MLKISLTRFVPIVLTVFISLSYITFHIQDVSADSTKDLAEKYRNAGYDLQKKGDLNGALKFYTKAIALGGATNPVLLNDVGILYEQLGIVGKAEQHYLQAIQQDSHYLPAYSNLAYLYLNAGYPDRAFIYFRKRYEMADLNDPWGQKAKEEMLKIKPEYKSWVLHFEAQQLNQAMEEREKKKLVAQVTQANQYYARGKEQLQDGELEKALVEYNKALSLTPDNPDIQEARQQVVRKLAAKQIQERSEIAIKNVKAGDSYSARREIQSILSTIPNEPIFNSR